MSESTNNFSIISVWGPHLAPDDSISSAGTLVVGSVDVGTPFTAVPLSSVLRVDALDVYQGL